MRVKGKVYDFLGYGQRARARNSLLFTPEVKAKRLINAPSLVLSAMIQEN